MPDYGSTMLSPPLAERLEAAEVDAHVRGWDKTSDHAPVWVELADKPVRQRHGAGSAPIKA